MLLNATSGIPNHLDLPVVSVPKASAVQVQSILFSSIASSLFAAFLEMLGKQWLNLYVEGSLIDRSRHRELRMKGMITWRFKTIMECLPIVMQVSLPLLGYVLARYVWDLSRTVSTVIAAFSLWYPLPPLHRVRRDGLEDVPVPDTNVPRSLSHRFSGGEISAPLATGSVGPVIRDG